MYAPVPMHIRLTPVFSKFALKNRNMHMPARGHAREKQNRQGRSHGVIHGP